jgi:hypothetical protein
MTDALLIHEDAAASAPLRPLVVAGVCIGVAWICTPFVVAQIVGIDWSVRGQLGDTFGSINSLFSGLAFAGIIYTVLLQRQELTLQRRELELTRRELTRSAAAQERSEHALSEQVRALNRSARLSALATTVEHYNLIIEESAGAGAISDAQRRRLAYLRAIEAELAILPA